MLFESDSEKKQQLYKKETFEKALELYKSRKFIEAFKQLENLKNDKLSLLYIKRCRFLIENPPDESWDGTFTMITK